MIRQEQPPRAESDPGESLSGWARDLEAYGRAVLRARTPEERHRWRQAGYIGVVICNAILLVIAHSLLRWSVPFITPAWADVLWAIDLSLTAGIIANAIFVSYDEPWFRDLVQLALTALALVAWLTLAQVFPFDFGDPGTNDLARLVGLLVVAALAIALLVQTIVWLVDRVRQALR
jgi:hypothetical protein